MPSIEELAKEYLKISDERDECYGRMESVAKQMSRLMESAGCKTWEYYRYGSYLVRWDSDDDVEVSEIHEGPQP